MALSYFNISKRRRGTAIVETEHGIVVAAGRSGVFLLPGGGANGHESRSKAAERELYEETSLKAYSNKYLFEHLGHTHRTISGKRWQDHHKVFLIKAKGEPRPHHEIRHIGFYTPGCHLKISSTTREIIERYYANKNHAELKRPEASSTRDGTIFLTSDLHLNHKNIIRYCHRPFKTTRSMNETLINNWNSLVGTNDKVYFLGDLAPFQATPKLLQWLKRLNGDIIRIQGSHDPPNFGLSHEILEYQGYKFFLVHNPRRNPKYGQSPIPLDWCNWIIHGHTHNNEMGEYPFINGSFKTINVSLELTKYRPISLEFLVSLDLNKIKRMDTIDSIPERY